MSTRTFWRPGDGRSLRRDRVPLDLRVPGRMVPREPLCIADTYDAWLPAATLQQALCTAAPIVARHVIGYPEPIELSGEHYRELAELPFGGQRRELLSPGLYVVTDTGPARRILYVGSGCDSTVRSRLVSHLFDGGRVSRAHAAFRATLGVWAAHGFPDADEADHRLRENLWRHNRWAMRRQALGGWRQVAADLVASGAFDIGMVRVPRVYSVVGRCLERFAAEFARARMGYFPPLNDLPVVLDGRLQPCDVPPDQAHRLFWALDDAARTVGVRA
jgi:hypothetical protein